MSLLRDTTRDSKKKTIRCPVSGLLLMGKLAMRHAWRMIDDGGGVKQLNSGDSMSKQAYLDGQMGFWSSSSSSNRGVKQRRRELSLTFCEKYVGFAVPGSPSTCPVARSQ